jgi:hypothetical protein
MLKVGTALGVLRSRTIGFSPVATPAAGDPDRRLA